MSRLGTTAIEAALTEFCERLNRFNEKAADKAEGGAFHCIRIKPEIFTAE